MTTKTSLTKALCFGLFLWSVLVSGALADEGRVVMRRLNRAEYENTVQDLLGVKVEVRELLPLDSSQNGFDNVGEALHVSSFLMEKYLHAAEKALGCGDRQRPAAGAHQEKV